MEVQDARVVPWAPRCGQWEVGAASKLVVPFCRSQHSTEWWGLGIWRVGVLGKNRAKAGIGGQSLMGNL